MNCWLTRTSLLTPIGQTLRFIVRQAWSLPTPSNAGALRTLGDLAASRSPKTLRGKLAASVVLPYVLGTRDTEIFSANL